MTEKTNNEDLLKVENLEQNEYLVSSSIIDVPEEKAEQKKLKVSVFKLILAALTPVKDESKQPAYYSLRPVKSVKYALFSLFFAVFVYIGAKILDSKIYVPLFLFYTSAVLPLFFITFQYELNGRRNITIFQMLFCFVFGMFLFVLINGLVDSLLVKSIYQNTIDIFIVPVLWGVGEAVFLAIVSKIYSITDTSTNILLAVCVGMGYAFINSLSSLYSGLFSTIEVAVSGQENNTVLAIVYLASYMEQSYEQVNKLIFWDCISFPFLISCWSVVMGTVVSLTKLLGAKRGESSFSVYLLLVLAIILYILTVFPSSIGYFEYILKIVCAIISLFVALRLENNAVYDTVNELYPETE